MTDRPRILDELGAELLRAARAEEGRGGARAHVARVPRAVIVGLAAVLLLGAVAAAATLIIGHGHPIPPAAPQDVPPELRPVAGTAHLNGLEVPDPDGGPSWDVRTSRSQTGAVCAAVGQVLDGELGLVGLDRRFRALPAGAADTCSRPQRSGATLAGARAFRGGGRLSDLTVVDGVAARSIRSAVAVAAGRTVRLRLGPDGAFLALFRGLPEQVRPRVVLTDASGHRTTLHFADTGEYIAPDPSGGAPWTLEPRAGARGLRCVAARRERGPNSPLPLGPGAFNFAPASAPPRCGRAAFVDIRRFVPRNQRIGRSFWWGLNPSRTVVWGAVGNASARVVLVGAGAPRALPVDARSHGFLAVLDGHVDPRRVVVRIDGRTLRGAAGALGTHGQRLAPEPVPAWRSVDSVVRRVAIPQSFVPDRRTLAIARRAQDIAGGPAWALQSWSARIDRRLRVIGGDRDMRCFNVGIDTGGGRLAEPLPGGRRRTLTLGERDALCNSRRWLAKHAGGAMVRTYVDDAQAPDPHPVRVVVAGLLGAGVRSAELLGAGAPRALALGRDGKFLAVLGPEVAGASLRIREVRADGTSVTSRPDGPDGTCRPLPGRAVRVADPDGGPSWTAGLGRFGHRDCRYLGRLVANRVAVVLDGLDSVLFGAAQFTAGSVASQLSAHRPLLLDLSGPGSEPARREAPTPPSPAQVARRTLPGRTVVTGLALPSVTSITLRTPRDVRTVRPGRGGVFLAVYDGAFYGGEIVATARLRDGRSVTQRIPASRP
jgi:hypothetical protein